MVRSAGGPPLAEALRDARPGERWVLRVRLADGSATDLVGWLDGWDTTAVQLSGPVDGSGRNRTWTVPAADVLLARRAPDARGGPAPSRTSPDALDRLGVEAWAVEAEPLGGWTLRSGSGFTGRANSCLAVGDPGVELRQAAERIEAYAEAHGIAPLAQVVTGSAEDRALGALGWTETYVATDVLAVRLTDLLAGSTPDRRVSVVEELTPAWRAAFDEYRPSSVDPSVVTRLLEGRRPRAFASLEQDGRPTSIGRGHLSAGWLGIAAVWTRPERRRQGLGTAVVLGLARWAARRDARWCYLQVETANAVAHAAYERLGFRLHHRYRYLAPPASAGDAGAEPQEARAQMT